jgi:hypothetical protein
MLKYRNIDRKGFELQSTKAVVVIKSSCSNKVSLIPGDNFPLMVNNYAYKLVFEYKE